MAVTETCFVNNEAGLYRTPAVHAVARKEGEGRYAFAPLCGARVDTDALELVDGTWNPVTCKRCAKALAKAEVTA